MRFVSTLTADYIPGIQALWRSLERNSNLTDIKFTVVQYDEAKPDCPFDCEYIPLKDLGTIRYRESYCTQPRHIPNLWKFSVWKIPHADETCCYLDADFICLNPLTGIDKLEHMSVVVNHNQLGKKPGYDFQYRVKGWVWNAGWFIYKPSVDTFNDIEKHANISPQQVAYGDQPIHVEYFDKRPETKFVSMNWNTSIWVYKTHRYLWDVNEIKLLHYADEWKPWYKDLRLPWQGTPKRIWDEYAQ